MNCQIVEIDPVADERWDKFVLEHPYGWVCHLSSWKEVIEQSFPHIKGHYLAVIDESNGFIIAAMPLFKVNSWLKGKKMVSIPFATLSDPLVNNGDELEMLLRYAMENLSENKSTCIEIKSYLSSDLLNATELVNDSEYMNHYLVLDKEPEELLATAFKTSIRRGINKAAKENIDVHETTDEKGVEEFYRLYVATRGRLGLPPQPRRFFFNLFDTLSSQGTASFLLARTKENILGGVVLLKYKNRASVDYLASDVKFRGISIDTFLWWSALKYSWEKGYRVFDFGRTSIQNNGLLEYKDRWGTTRKKITHYSNEKSPDLDREKSLLYKTVRQICLHAPRPMLQVIGNVIYRHMG